ncbi:N-acetyltransferase [Patescibacteria group bacterium]|nr:N-acetyltransferase [Patescibacteria group bacterium]MBU1963968.1 N-acetyltransferase [Patescibacteria group bacterium]
MAKKNFFQHENSLVESDDIGENTRIWAFSHILKRARIGKNCNICDHTFIESDVIVGNDVTIKCGVYLWEGIRIEDNVFIGPNATFTNDMRPRSKEYPEKFIETSIRKGASIGANATIIAGSTIGSHALIGAGSVVTSDIPAFAKAYGVPAKVKGFICACAKDLDFQGDTAKCSCGKIYKKKSERLIELQ